MHICPQDKHYYYFLWATYLVPVKKLLYHHTRDSIYYLVVFIAFGINYSYLFLSTQTQVVNADFFTRINNLTRWRFRYHNRCSNLEPNNYNDCLSNRLPEAINQRLSTRVSSTCCHFLASISTSNQTASTRWRQNNDSAVSAVPACCYQSCAGTHRK